MSLPLTDVCAFERPSVECKNKNPGCLFGFRDLQRHHLLPHCRPSFLLPSYYPFLMLMSLVFHPIDV